jgi:hypothetical protein
MMEGGHIPMGCVSRILQGMCKHRAKLRKVAQGCAGRAVESGSVGEWERRVPSWNRLTLRYGTKCNQADDSV